METTATYIKRTKAFCLALLACMLVVGRALAQDVIVTVTPVQNILPPQILLYISDPGKYFNVMLTNTTQQSQDVYLTMQLQQVMPASNLSISTPSRRQPPKPFTVPANGTRQLTMTEIKTLFNHVPSNEITATPGLFDNYANGTFGLLPEGEYEARLTAYRWASPKLAVPVVVSSPTGGTAHFTVCYKAQAPQFLTPVSTSLSLENSEVADLDALMPMFTWTQPVITCNAMAMGFKYNFKVVEVMANQSPTEAIDRNPVVYKADNLMAAQCIIPNNIISSQFHTDRTYAAQITAVSTSTNVLNYVMLENEGKSTYRLFRLKTREVVDKEEPQTPQNETPPAKEPEDEQIAFDWGDDDVSGLISEDSLYTFSLPNLIKPVFPENGGARKAFMGSSIQVEWVGSLFRGGEGNQADTIQIAYDVEIFSGEQVCDMKAALETTPIYKHRTTELKDSVPWDSIKDLVENGTYMVLRVNPVVTKGSSVAFLGDSTNIRDFALVEMLSKKFFQCSNMIDITNTKPTTKSASDLKGKVIKIGEYELTIDDISSAKKDTWKGTGHVLWKPMGVKVHVCVKFDDLAINTDDQVYAGVAYTYSRETVSSSEAVDKLFSDWGIDNLISDTGIPYASELQSTTTGAVKDIAKQIDLSQYYGYIKTGQAIYDSFLTGEVQDLYMPLSLPKSVNTTPVDIQIANMKFAASYATMDVIGEFTLPNSKYTKNDILVFGAPRLCISPSRVLPESGTIALLSNFTIKDPKSSYEMTFKAPQNVLEPEDGCYIAWHADKLEMLGIDVDMIIPGLVKDNNGTATNEKPVFNARASISSWDDWMIDDITIDPFQVEKLPGWTFTASDIVYDHSAYRNSNKMGAFPKGYDKSKAGITGVVTNAEGQTYQVSGDKDWQGLYIKEIGIKFPKALEIGTSGDKRLNIKAQNMFFDKSGATLEVSAGNIISAKTGQLGGWEFSLDKVYASFLQNDFSRCGFSGKLGVPLLEGTIGYECRIMKLTSNTANAGQYAYVFKTQQTEGLSLDFFLGKAKFNKDQTYFLLESTPKSDGTLQTNLELVLGGDITIGGTDYLNNKIKDSSLPLKFEIPGVHFCGMRLANNKSFTSKYESAMQQKAMNASLSGISLYSGKQFEFASGKVYFSTGKWSLASAQKTLGPFAFSLDKYNFNYKNNKLSASLEGTIKFIDGIELGASAGITINANVKLPSDLKKVKDIKVSYGSTDFDKCGIEAKFAGMELSGSLTVERGDKTKEGYTGKIKFTMPGDLFAVDANGGYYKYQSGSTKYTYGFFCCKLSSNVGLRADPVVINSITAGFYYNCKKKSDTECTPQKGCIGVVAGLALSTTAGEEALKADMDVTVIYDKNKKRLSTFIFNGKVEAVSGLVTAKANMVYENNDQDRYLQVDITVDASADAEKLTTVTGANKSLSSLKSEINSGYKQLQKLDPTGSLADMKEEDGKPDKSKASKNGSSCSASMGAKVSLQVKVTWKEKGTSYSKPHWHLYLGEPDFNKRCQFTLLKFKSSVVSVDFGANGYICVGNELPNNGKLPEIPSQIRNFLNGGNSSGIEGADVSKANRARENSMKEFNDQIESIGGGVMFGAQVWGYINVDLGVFYLYTGATAGFDMSIVKLPNNVYCTNISGKPGYKGWYGYGQLYAYLYAKFGLHFNLGFWKKDFDVVDAGIGGVFRMQGPKPTHFDGEARVKLRLLNGLVNVNRKYSFSCGKGCDLFMGNALDKFELFGDLSIGYAEKELGWKESNAIQPKLLTRPYLYTQAPLNQPFRVLDETELARMRKNYDGDASDLEAQASRTFYFRSAASSYITVQEYTREPKSSYDFNNPAYTRYFYIKASDGTNNLIDMTQLNPNRFYRVTVTGYAKEIHQGKEVDPLNYNEYQRKYVNTPWSQTKVYYFRTGQQETIPDCPDLQDYVAIAYPSYYNQLKSSDNYFYVHEHDMKYPTIALTTNLKETSFKQGDLYWRLYKGNRRVCSVKNKWVTTSNTCNMTPESALSGYKSGEDYTLKLEYEIAKTTRKRIGFGRNARTETHVTYETTELASMVVYTYTGNNSSDWLNGHYYEALAYELPFIGTRVNYVNFENSVPNFMYNHSVTDYEMSRDNKFIGGMQYRRYDPYLYIAYLANYGFFGGWEFDADRIDMSVTTAQSLIYTDKGGVYEGKLGSAQNVYNCYNDYKKIRALSIYDRDQWSKITQYPLPLLNDPKYSYVTGGLSRINKYSPDKDNYWKVRSTINDFYRVYLCAAVLGDQIYDYARQIDQLDADNGSFTNEANAMQNWYNQRVGTYCTASFDGVISMMVPAYQFPIAWGSMLSNSGSKKKLTAWGTLKGYSSAAKSNSHARGHESNSEWVFCDFIGSSYVKGDSMDKKNKHGRGNFVMDRTSVGRMTSANFSVYRVNAYDYNNCQYTVNTSLSGPNYWIYTFDVNKPLLKFLNW